MFTEYLLCTSHFFRLSQWNKIYSPLGFPSSLSFFFYYEIQGRRYSLGTKRPSQPEAAKSPLIFHSQCFHHRGCQLRLWKISDICCISLKLNLMHSQLADNEGNNQKYCQKLRLKNPVWKTGLGEQFSWAAEMLSPAPNPPPSPGLKVLLYFCLR